MGRGRGGAGGANSRAGGGGGTTESGINRVGPAPRRGMGVTQNVGSDSYPHTVSRVINDRTIEVRRDNYRAAPGSNPYGNQEYIYTRNRTATPVTLTLRQDGRWRRQGESMRSQAWTIGNRRAYQNPSY